MEELYSKLYAKLTEATNTLHRDLNTEDYPTDVEQDILAAIVYMDCARENLMRHMCLRDGIYRVVPHMVAKTLDNEG